MMHAGRALCAGLLILAAGCGTSAPKGAQLRGSSPTAAATSEAAAPRGQLRWTGAWHVRGIVDLSAPAPDRTIRLAARGRLLALRPSGAVTPFAPAYAAPPGLEPYVALSSARRVPGAGCAFTPGTLFALRLAHGDGVTAVTAQGGVRRFAALPRRGLENGIAFDMTGRFGYRLLVTTSVGSRTTVSGIDCRGRVRVVTRSAPRVEGGIAVAPAGFGRFGGDLIAPDELTGRIWAIAADGATALVAQPPIPHGQDVGVESEGFVPAGAAAALVADRGTPRNPHPGDDLILRLTTRALRTAGVRPGDLLVVAEGGAGTAAIACRPTCQDRIVATGPPEAHIEGHVVFTPGAAPVTERAARAARATSRSAAAAAGRRRTPAAGRRTRRPARRRSLRAGG